MNKKLLKSTDAKVWAERFVQLHGGDVELLTTWFANAIDAGWESGRSVANENTRRWLYARSHGHSGY